MNTRKKVLFICTHNSARSQMAEGLLRALYGDIYESYSAGTMPSGVSSYSIRAMSEIGIDISRHSSKSVDEFSGVDFDYVVTVCDHAKETCPVFLRGKTHIHRDFENPSGFSGDDERIITGFRRVRDEIKEWIEETFPK